MKYFVVLKACLGVLLIAYPIWAAGMFFLEFNGFVYPPMYDKDVKFLWLSRSGLFLGLSAMAGAYLLSNIKLKDCEKIN